MALSKSSRAYVDIEANHHGLLKGVTVVIDPSVGSSSSMPGWAVYRQGSYVASGIFELPRTKPIQDRLRALSRALTKLYGEYQPDVLVYEDIPAQRHGMGNAVAHASLHKALGVILSVPGPAGFVGIMPISWKKLVRDTYIKGDEADAVEMGHVVIELAHEIMSRSSKGGK